MLFLGSTMQATSTSWTATTTRWISKAAGRLWRTLFASGSQPRESRDATSDMSDTEPLLTLTIFRSGSELNVLVLKSPNLSGQERDLVARLIESSDWDQISGDIVSMCRTRPTKTVLPGNSV